MCNSLKFMFLLFLTTVIISCENEKEPKLIMSSAKDFIFNIPINGDTIYMDRDYGTDFVVEIEGCTIDSVKIKINSLPDFKFDTININTSVFKILEGNHHIDFRIYGFDIKNNKKFFYQSNQYILKVSRDLSKRFIRVSDKNGSLNIQWPHFDKRNATHYLVERFMGDNNEFVQKFEVFDSIFIDKYYVGEKVNYKIWYINKENKMQATWCYFKDKEKPTFSITQNKNSGYDIKISSCKYYNNFKQYVLADKSNTTPKVNFISNSVLDTSFHLSNARFGDDVILYFSCLPKDLPEGINQESLKIYENYLYLRDGYGDKSFQYDQLAKINDKTVVYTFNGNIYRRDLVTDLITYTIANKNTYTYVMTSPTGKYIFSPQESAYNPPVDCWMSNEMTNNPKYTIKVNYYTSNSSYVGPPISDNLILIKSIPCETTSCTLGIYNAIDGNLIYTTPYSDSSYPPVISSNGNYFFTSGADLKLCSFIDNKFKLIVEIPIHIGYYSFYNFNPNDNEICYLYDLNHNFSVRRTSDFSEITSFKLDVVKIENIDYFSGKIMGTGINGNILIYNLNDGKLVKDISANHQKLFSMGSNTIMIGNALYNSRGIKYLIGD